MNENELFIPEELALKYMPKLREKKSRNNNSWKKKLKNLYKPNQQTYVEQLECYVDHVEPSALKVMLRDARHKQIIVPNQKKKFKNLIIMKILLIILSFLNE